MAVWEGLTPDEALDLTEGSELLLVPNGTGGHGSVGALQFCTPKSMIYDKTSKLDFKKYYYLARVEND